MKTYKDYIDLVKQEFPQSYMLSEEDYINITKDIYNLAYYYGEDVDEDIMSYFIQVYKEKNALIRYKMDKEKY